MTAFRTEFFDDLKSLAKKGYDFELMRKPIEADQLVEAVRAILGSA